MQKKRKEIAVIKSFIKYFGVTRKSEKKMYQFYLRMPLVKYQFKGKNKDNRVTFIHVWYVHTHMQFQKIYLSVPRPSSFCLCQHNFFKKSAFFLAILFGKNTNFTQSNSKTAMLEIFWFCFQFLLDKRLVLPKIKFYRPCVRDLASGWLQNGYQSEKKTTSQFADMKSSSIFLTLLFLLSSYQSKFHVNIMTGTGVVTISVYNGLTRN